MKPHRPHIFLIVLFVASSFPVTDSYAELRCEIVSAEDVLASSRGSDDRLVFTSRSGRTLTLLTDPRQLSLSNPIAGREFFPHRVDQVSSALSELDEFGPRSLSVTIYCLPGLPEGIGRSFCEGAEIFLAPGLASVPDPVVAYTVVHELGHAVQHAFMPGRDGGVWQEYLRRRGIDDASIYHDRARHRDRPGEIFAEDFRALFGGPLANYSGTIENSDLPHPRAVTGLASFFHKIAHDRRQPADRFAVSSFPNPFNPRTVITVEFPAATRAAWVAVAIYDLRGRRLRDWSTSAESGRVEVEWNGTDDSGRRVGSGTYFYRVTALEQSQTGSMVLLQ